MKLNNIQKKIYEQYKKTGKVWADCPRQCGKTELIVRIVKEETKKGNRVGVFSRNGAMNSMLLARLKKELPKEQYRLVMPNHELAEVRVFDEMYHLGGLMNQKHVCLRTRDHPLMQFTWRDMDEKEQEELKKLKDKISPDMWALEFNNGVNE